MVSVPTARARERGTVRNDRHTWRRRAKLKLRCLVVAAAAGITLTVASVVLWVDSAFTETLAAHARQRATAANEIDKLRWQGGALSGQMSLMYRRTSLVAPTRDELGPHRAPQPDLWHFRRVSADGRRYRAGGESPSVLWPVTYWKNDAIDHHRGPLRIRSRSVQLVLELRATSVALAAVSAVLLFQWRRARLPFVRDERGHCVRCGYDLRAAPEQGRARFDRCPECGQSSGAAVEIRGHEWR